MIRVEICQGETTSSPCAVSTTCLCTSSNLITFPVQTIIISHLLIDFPASTPTIYSLLSSCPDPSKLWVWSCHSSAPSPLMASHVPVRKAKFSIRVASVIEGRCQQAFSIKGQIVNIFGFCGSPSLWQRNSDIAGEQHGQYANKWAWASQLDFIYRNRQ